MAIGHVQSGLYYDVNRDMFYTERERYERELYRQKEDEYRRQQALMQNPSYNPYVEQPKLANAVPKPDTKDPLSFLSKADNKLLLTGEAP
jgi:hypothetical protein